jgi:hypothetical protein
VCSKTIISLQTDIQGTKPGPAFHVSTTINNANATIARRPLTTSAFCATKREHHITHKSGGTTTSGLHVHPITPKSIHIAVLAEQKLEILHT